MPLYISLNDIDICLNAIIYKIECYYISLHTIIYVYVFILL